MDIGITEASINDFGCLVKLKDTVNKTKAKAYFQELEGNPISTFKVNIMIYKLLQKFIIDRGVEL